MNMNSLFAPDYIKKAAATDAKPDPNGRSHLPPIEDPQHQPKSVWNSPFSTAFNVPSLFANSPYEMHKAVIVEELPTENFDNENDALFQSAMETNTSD